VFFGFWRPYGRENKYMRKNEVEEALDLWSFAR
jgi:hypothetical protein